ncbi:MAG: hypothetical protein L7G90_01905 [Candidatus Nanopusillus sp.]|nr:hypothetical protein [Candidatus Nanopusillus sp.]MCG2868857.1 hypothetical protein [Candidatus Nanopusillus sp.]
MGTSFPIQGYRSQKSKQIIALGGIYDEFSATYNNDTNSVTLSSNGTAKSYNVWIPYPAQSSNPLINYLVLVIQVSGYISLASGASSGSATISVVLNGNTLYSTTISNTNNEMIINQVIPYSQFPTYNQNGMNTLEIQVQLGSGAASVTISQVQYMFGILLNGGSNGLTIEYSFSQGVIYINEDPSNVQFQGNSPFGLGVTVYIYDPFGITTGISEINLENGTVTINTNGSNTYVGRAFPVAVQGGVANASFTISVSANNSILIAYYHVAIIVNVLVINKGYAHELILIKSYGWGITCNLGWIYYYNFNPPELGIFAGVSLPSDPLLNLYWFIANWYNWYIMPIQAYGTANYVAEVGNARLYKLTYPLNYYILEFHHIADFYIEWQNYYNGCGNNMAAATSQGPQGYMLGRILHLEVTE